ncbi:helicase SNF2 [Thiocystis minor]|uniref:DEAD/DEAH box helicase n=1 Tax=Thiocystis minor TaxID=61597 RepID=UPI001911D8C4|nr:DEAD/DEAH box helicase [Thiocystis minor]MBK5966856.1 helicase SNF2 [Thiocystis minor]
MATVIEAAQELPADERRILQVVSVVHEAVNQTSLQAILHQLGWRDQKGQPLSTLFSTARRTRLLVQRILVKQGNNFFCAPDLAEMLTRETVREGTFDRIVAAAETVMSAKSRYQWETVSERRQTRRLRNALYAGREADILTLLGLDKRGPEQPVSYREVESLTRICTASPDPDWFATLSPRLRILALAPWMTETSLALIPRPEMQAFMERGLTPLAAEHPEAACALAEQYLFRGHFDQAAAILGNRITPETLPLIGWLHLARGRHEESLEVFDLHLATLRRQTRKRNLAVPGLPGILHLLALLRRGTPADLERVQTQAGLVLRLPVADPSAPVFQMLSQLASVLAGRQRPQEASWLREGAVVKRPFDLLFLGLMRHWLGERPGLELLKSLATHCEDAVTAGIHWYAWEGVELLRLKGRPLQIAALPAPPKELVRLAGLLTPKSAWEIALEALKGVGTTGGEGKTAPGGEAGADRRMCWQLALYGGQGTLEPREQKRKKAGGWSQGRPVALQKLAESPNDYDYLTPQDRRICGCIHRETETGWYGGYGRTHFSLDSDAALLAAVGHPLVFRAGAMETPLELVRGGPALEVVKGDGVILVRINPVPPEGSNLLLVSESAARIRLIQFDATHRRIASILGAEGLKVPPDGKERLLEGIAAIAPLLTVHSAIGGTEQIAETVPADPRPYLHLNPAEAGLNLELLMQPLGEKGPRLLPGQGLSTLFGELDGRAVQTTRDLVGERRNAQTVLDACPTLAEGRAPASTPSSSGSEAEGGDWTWCLDDPEEALTALEQLHALGDAVVLQWPEGKRIGLSREATLARMSVSIAKERDWLGLEGGLTLDDGSLLGMRKLLELVADSKGRFVRLDEREYLVLSESLRRRLDNLRGLTDRGHFHPLAAAAIEESLEGMAVKSSKHWKGLLARLAEVRELEPAIPSTLQAELRDYQVEGYRWLARLAHWGAGACLADDMGLGKTVQALAMILARAPEGPTLVLAPMSVCSNWVSEARRFAPTLQPKRFGEGDRERMLESAGPFDLIISTYGLLQTEGERLAGVNWSTIVADEAQAFKNAQTKRSQAIMKLNAGFRMITTGTPIENHLGELWNLFRFINPGLLGSLDSFNQRFAVPIEVHQDSGARQRLRQLLKPFILRRLKTDVLSELPPRTEITLELEFSAAEAALYEALRRQAIERLELGDANPGQKRMQLLAEIMRLRRACCHPKLALPDSDIPSAKLDAFGEIVDELLENRHKALVFSQFVDHLHLIRAHLDARGVRYQYLDGSTPEAKRKTAVAAFQAGEGDLFLISLRAGGSGLNLTAADYVIHMDPWWNPAVEDQASDRAHRIGQERPVTIYRLITKGTIEEKIIALHASKRDLADGLLEGAGDGGRLSYEDMLALIREQG